MEMYRPSPDILILSLGSVILPLCWTKYAALFFCFYYWLFSFLFSFSPPLIPLLLSSTTPSGIHRDLILRTLSNSVSSSWLQTSAPCYNVL
ncbi:hypothetical protein BKA59DRAFT_269375 [Fusarium tricinctum]|uniref:Uncharacterized protein n=1 Tax=Fusarium tricinctum TaxID=61284 RepID=A0A8K0RRF1_9HYPO|nr:hypothetical protein BKA59DRAFT_269375 [Fusarium tricinctum]